MGADETRASIYAAASARRHRQTPPSCNWFILDDGASDDEARLMTLGTGQNRWLSEELAAFIEGFAEEGSATPPFLVIRPMSARLVSSR